MQDSIVAYEVSFHTFFTDDAKSLGLTNHAIRLYV